MRRVSTFDIFDTVLTRRVALPRSNFFFVGQRAVAEGLVQCSPHAFADIRHASERHAFQNYGGLDSAVSLTTIYEEVVDSLQLPDDRLDALVAAELSVERDALVPVTAGIERVVAARAAGHEIAFVSDMYLPSWFLMERLEHFNIMEPDDALIVSNEVCRSKTTGTIWQHVTDLYPDAKIVHCGNDPRGDGKTARQAGIDSVVLDNHNPNRYEDMLERHHRSTDGLSSQLAGASRIARLEVAAHGNQALVDVAAGVAAPFVIGNVLWTLRTARERGIAKLFFVSRDGKLLRDVAEILAPKVGYQGELNYLYGSRQAWCLASYSEANPTALDALVPIGTDTNASLRDVLARVDLSPELLGERFGADFPAPMWDQPLDPASSKRLRTLLEEDLDLNAELTLRAKSHRELVLDYLEEAGVITNESIGLVDLGTGASLFNALGAICGSVGQDPPTGFYFGLRSKLPRSPYGRPLTYVRNEERRLGYLSTPGLLTFAEMVCTAGHGSVLGYAETASGQVAPVLSDDDNSSIVEWGLPIVHETICRVAEELGFVEDLSQMGTIDLRPAIVDVFNLFWTTPSHAEAACWGAYPFEDGWGTKATRSQLAERRRVYHAVTRQPHRHWWPGGAKRLSGPATRLALDSRQIAQTAAPKVKQRLVRLRAR